MRRPNLDQRLEALREAAVLARGAAPDQLVDAAEAVVSRAGARLGLGMDATVVALAGPTGAGKSTLFNELAGAPLAVPGHLRPTTSQAMGAIWGDVDEPLLDWLQLATRHRLGGEPDGLVLVDLPDFDSVRIEHHVEADRLIEHADLLVWVLDPQKYADDVVHARYLRPLAHHQASMLVVLNQVDRLGAVARDQCIHDLRRLLAEDGLPDVPVLAASAVDGTGIADLRLELARRVRAREAALARIDADAASAARLLLEGSALAGRAAGVGAADRASLVSALASAAGVGTVVRATRRAHRRRGALATGWPVVRSLRRLRPDPLRRLRLQQGDGDRAPVEQPHRTSLPAAGRLEAAQAGTAARTLAGGAAGTAGDPWPRLLREAALASREALPDRLDAAVAATDLRLREPFWWRLAGALQWLLAGAMLVGGLWLLVLAALGFLHLDTVIPTPTLEGIAWPTLLFVGGALAGIFLALLAGFANRIGAARRARVAERALLRAVGDVADDAIIEPVRAQIERRDRLRQLLSLVVAAR